MRLGSAGVVLRNGRPYFRNDKGNGRKGLLGLSPAQRQSAPFRPVAGGVPHDHRQGGGRSSSKPPPRACRHSLRLRPRRSTYIPGVRGSEFTVPRRFLADKPERRLPTLVQEAEGIAKGKATGVYRGRPENVDRNFGIAAMLRAGQSWSAIQRATGCSRATVAKIAKRAA